MGGDGIKGKKARVFRNGFLVNVSETPSLSQTVNFLHKLKLCAKFGSALVSSSLKDVFSSGGTHSLTESVNFASLSFFGLISSFHFYILAFIIIKI